MSEVPFSNSEIGNADLEKLKHKSLNKKNSDTWVVSCPERDLADVLNCLEFHFGWERIGNGPFELKKTVGQKTGYIDIEPFVEGMVKAIIVTS